MGFASFTSAKHGWASLLEILGTTVVAGVPSRIRDVIAFTRGGATHAGDSARIVEAVGSTAIVASSAAFVAFAEGFGGSFVVWLCSFVCLFLFGDFSNNSKDYK